MKGLIVLTIFLVARCADAGSNERYPKIKRQTYDGTQSPPPPPSPPVNYGQGQGGVLPPGVIQPQIPPTYGNDKGAGHVYQDYDDVNTLPGIPGQDYPVYGPHPPQTNFDCARMPHVPGYYANVDYGCQVFHVCEDGGKLNTFVCPNGTIYNQRYFVCDWWYNVNCAEATSFYGVNGDLYQVPPGGYGPSGPAVPGGVGGYGPSGPAVPGGVGGYGPSGPAIQGGAGGYRPSGPAIQGGAGGYRPSGPAIQGGAGGYRPSGPAIQGSYGQPVAPPSGGYGQPVPPSGGVGAGVSPGAGYSGPGVGVQRYTPPQALLPGPTPTYSGGSPTAHVGGPSSGPVPSSGYGVVSSGVAPSSRTGGSHQVSSGGGYGSRTSVADSYRPVAATTGTLPSGGATQRPQYTPPTPGPIEEPILSY